jgi:hypothetical protein
LRRLCGPQSLSGHFEGTQVFLAFAGIWIPHRPARSHVTILTEPPWPATQIHCAAKSAFLPLSFRTRPK